MLDFMNKWFFVGLLGILCARGESVLTIDGEEYSLQQFYAHYPKKQWDAADSTKRTKIYTDFIRRELCVLEAKRLSLKSDPGVSVKIRDRLHQLFVNESYEQLVAWPLIGPEDLKDAHRFARKEVFVSHILQY